MSRRLVLLLSAFSASVVLLVATRHNIFGLDPSIPAKWQYTSDSRPENTHWTFVAARDRNDHSLTQEQCDAAFPDLYSEIDRSRTYWKARQGSRKLTEDQWGIEWSHESGLRAMIHNGQLRIVESRGLNHFQHWEERSKATLANIHRAVVASRETIPDIEFSIKIDDNIHLEEGTDETTVWCFSRDVTNPTMDQVWLIPDFNFWAYPRVAGAYGDFQQEAMQIGEDYDAKIPKLVWRGTQVFNPGVRQALLDVSRNQSWSDVHEVKEDSGDAESAHWRIPLPDHCRYKYAVHTEGTTWSGRLKYLLSCHSTIIVHPLTFTTHLYHLLQGTGKSQNCIQAQSDWSDLPDIMESMLADEAESRRIADNARDMFRDRYMTPAAQTCYFRRLFEVWAEMTPTPDPYVSYLRTDGTSMVGLRGMTYEEYIFHKGDVPA